MSVIMDPRDFVSYEDISRGKVFEGALPRGNVSKFMKRYNGIGINDLSQYFRSIDETGIPWRSVENFWDRNFGTTYGVDKSYIVPGLKKGGRINVTAGIFH